MIVVTNNDILGTNIVHLRNRHGLSQEELASQIHMDVETLWKLENQKTYQIHDSQLMQLCRLFKKTVEELLERKNP